MSQESEEEKYRKLASEAREHAQSATDPYDKRTLLAVAQRYDELADRARNRRERSKPDQCA